jgi:trk system potassium uptake protein TrkH
MLVLALSAAGLVPLVVDLAVGASAWPWIIMLLTAVVVGGGLLFAGRRANRSDLRIREGIVITSMIWFLFSAVAAIPLAIATPANFVLAWFEAVSGLTATGATIFGDADFYTLADLTAGMHLWRSLLQWMGGIGIVVISLALLPLITGSSGFQLYRNEVPGLDAERLQPRIRDTARWLLYLYLGLTALIMLGLLLCGVGLFPAICHAMTCVATAGFSIYDDSAEGLNSHAAEWVLIAGMLLSGMNFSLLLAAVLGKRHLLWRSTEARAYIIGMSVASALVIAILMSDAEMVEHYDGSTSDMIRDGIFQVVSILTTTGYATGYDAHHLSWWAWPPAAIALLTLLMPIGGCAGSTSGGIKVVRFLVGWRAALREFRRQVEPARISVVRLDNLSLSNDLILQVGAFFFIFFSAWGLGGLAIALCGNDLMDSFSAAISCLANIGPALGNLGPAGNFRGLGEPSLLIGIFLMILGRLELFGLLIALSWTTWRH